MVFLLASVNAKPRSRCHSKFIANLERFSELITFPHHRIRDFHFINLNLLARDVSIACKTVYINTHKESN